MIFDIAKVYRPANLRGTAGGTAFYLDSIEGPVALFVAHGCEEAAAEELGRSGKKLYGDQYEVDFLPPTGMQFSWTVHCRGRKRKEAAALLEDYRDAERRGAGAVSELISAVVPEPVLQPDTPPSPAPNAEELRLEAKDIACDAGSTPASKRQRRKNAGSTPAVPHHLDH